MADLNELHEIAQCFEVERRLEKPRFLNDMLIKGQRRRALRILSLGIEHRPNCPGTKSDFCTCEGEGWLT